MQYCVAKRLNEHTHIVEERVAPAILPFFIESVEVLNRLFTNVLIRLHEYRPVVCQCNGKKAVVHQGVPLPPATLGGQSQDMKIPHNLVGGLPTKPGQGRLAQADVPKSTVLDLYDHVHFASYRVLLGGQNRIRFEVAMFVV